MFEIPDLKLIKNEVRALTLTFFLDNARFDYQINENSIILQSSRNFQLSCALVVTI